MKGEDGLKMVKPFNAVFRYDGKTLTGGRVRLHVSECEVEGVDFGVPIEYGALLLHEETEKEAWRLLEEVSRSPFMDKVKTALLETACKEGFEKAWSLLEKFNREAPRGKPRFYANLNVFDLTADGRFVVLTDGKSAFKFSLSPSQMPENLNLPVNVYCRPSSTIFTLTVDRFKTAVENAEEFFDFIKELKRIYGFVSDKRRMECFIKFFEDRKQAYEMLKALSKDAGRRIRRDEIYRTLVEKKVLEFSEGFFVYNEWWGAYYVTKNGEVYRFKCTKPVDIREAVQRGVEKGKAPKKIEPVEDERVLREIARAVGSVKPELALIISP